MLNSKYITFSPHTVRIAFSLPSVESYTKNLAENSVKLDEIPHLKSFTLKHDISINFNWNPIPTSPFKYHALKNDEKKKFAKFQFCPIPLNFAQLHPYKITSLGPGSFVRNRAKNIASRAGTGD